MSCCIYFAALAISDNIALLWGLDFLITGAFLKSLSQWHCNILSFAFNWATTCSIGLIVCLTGDRWLAICFPFRFHSWRTPSMALRIAMAVTSFTGIYNVIHIFTTQAVDGEVCAAFGKHSILSTVSSLLNVFMFSLRLCYPISNRITRTHENPLSLIYLKNI